MRCPTCGKELIEESAACPHCGAGHRESGAKAELGWGWSDPGRTLAKWPAGEAGEPVAPAFLTHCSSLSFEDEMLISMLNAYGIPCLKQFPNNGALGRVVLGVSGTGTDIYVPATMLDEARDILEGESDVQV
ncbi:MAG TPA: hypothetical protein GXZ52_01325 [Clostridiales bacterium]|nr:hypothetical protein [Clostridiales bacterium]